MRGFVKFHAWIRLAARTPYHWEGSFSLEKQCEHTKNTLLHMRVQRMFYVDDAQHIYYGLNVHIPTLRSDENLAQGTLDILLAICVKSKLDYVRLLCVENKALQAAIARRGHFVPDGLGNWTTRL